MTAEAIPCCCGGVDCCPFSSVTWSAGSGTIRINNLDANGQILTDRIRTVASTNPISQSGALIAGDLATIALRPEVLTARVIPKVITTGTLVPFCIYKSAAVTAPAQGFHTGSFIRRVDTFDPNTGAPITVYFQGGISSVVYVAQTWGFGDTGGTCWEAGIVGSITFRPPLFYQSIPNIVTPIAITARAPIVPNGCPVNLFYQTGSFNSSTYWAGTVRAPAYGFNTGGGARVGYTTPTTVPLSLVQYGIMPDSGISVSIQ